MAWMVSLSPLLTVPVLTWAIAATAQAPVPGPQGQWTMTTPLPIARISPASVAFDGKMYVFGGSYPRQKDTQKYDVADNSEFDPGTERWQMRAPMPRAYENISKMFSCRSTSFNEGRASDVLAGQLLGAPLKTEQYYQVPPASYTFDHMRLGWETIPPLMDRASPLRTSHLRDPYGTPVLFGSESFLDEIAAAADADPVAFRLRYLTHPRDRDAVRIAAEGYGWDARPSPRNDQQHADVAIGRGIAFRRHFTTFVALVAEVRVHRKTGQIDPIRYVCAHDCGLIVNPDTLRHVIDRQLVYGTSQALFEEVQFDENMVTSVDWKTYRVLHIDAAPQRIDIHLISRPEEPPSGAGELALGLVPAAIGNAVFDATGVRLRRVPFITERVKAALEGA